MSRICYDELRLLELGILSGDWSALTRLAMVCLGLLCAI